MVRPAKAEIPMAWRKPGWLMKKRLKSGCFWCIYGKDDVDPASQNLPAGYLFQSFAIPRDGTTPGIVFV
jgi:hypothetical protein